MSVFDGEVIRIRVYTVDRYGNHGEIVRYVDSNPGPVVAGLKGARRYGDERTIAVRVDTLRFVKEPISKYDFGEDW